MVLLRLWACVSLLISYCWEKVVTWQSFRTKGDKHPYEKWVDAIQELNQLFHLVTELGLGCTALTCLLCLPVSRSTFLLHQVHRTLLLYFPAVPSSILLCNTLCVVLTCFYCNTLLCPIMWSVAFYFFPQMLQFCVVHPRLPFCFVNVACCAFAAHRSDWPVVAFPAVARQTSAQPLTSTSSSASSTTSTSTSFTATSTAHWF